MRRTPALLALFGALALSPVRLAAQGFTAQLSVRGNVIDLRGLERDSLPESAVAGDGLHRTLEDGTIVTCIPDEYCRWYPSGAVQSVSLVTQDLTVAAWPGIQGLAAYVHLRGRYGTDDFWPRSSQNLEALYAYASYDRGDFQVRAGRQYRVNGLGYYNFDGAALAWKGLDPLRVEVYGGWSLARNLDQPRNGTLLTDADEFAPDKRGLIVGVDVKGRYGRSLTGAASYVREIRSDRKALYDERVSGDLGYRIWRVGVDLSADYDLGFGELNEGKVRVTGRLPAGLEATAQYRRYTPHFELWTIWGVFDPVGYDEGGGTLAWRVPGAGVRLEGGGAWRQYDDTHAGAEFARLESNGWRGYGRVRVDWRRWFADAAYRAAEGSGAARYGGDLTLGRTFAPGTWLALHGTSTQSFSEFRLGEELLAGGGLEGALRVGEDVSITGSWAAYDLTYTDRPSSKDWTQYRAHLGVTYRFGTEPTASSAGKGGYR